ncbi:hypothetical protein [Vibrio phage RYC]|nr:hypothetical protein [Vibrio phage RYC]
MKTKLLGILLSVISYNCIALEEDKQKHIAVSTVISSGVQYTYDDWKLSMASCMAVGLGKELYDEYDYGGFDEKDLVADLAGCTLGTFVTKGLTSWYEDGTLYLNYEMKF